MKYISLLSLKMLFFASFLGLVSCDFVDQEYSGTSEIPSHNISSPQHIALLLPLTGPLSSAGKSVQAGFMDSYQKALRLGKTEAGVRVYDTTALGGSAYAQAIEAGADFVVGPLDKPAVQQVAGMRLPVTTLVLNYTEANAHSGNLYQLSLSPLDEALQAAREAWHQGHRAVILIAPSDPWSQNIAQTFVRQWTGEGGRVTDQLQYTPNQDLNTAVKQLLHVRTQTRAEENTRERGMRRQDFDLLFLVATPEMGRQIVPLLRFYYAYNIPIYSTSMIYSGTPDPFRDSDLNGVRFDDMPWMLGAHAPSGHTPRLYALGQDAFMLTQSFNALGGGLPGATGTLTLNANQQIIRTLNWAEFKNGKPVVISN